MNDAHLEACSRKKYLDILWDIIYKFQNIILIHIYTPFEIPNDICKSLNLEFLIILEEDKRIFLYAYTNHFWNWDEDGIRKEIHCIIDEIIDSSYNVGGEKFLECQGNIEKLLLQN